MSARRDEAGVRGLRGLESRHSSRYFVWRQGQRRHWEHWPKLTFVTLTGTLDGLLWRPLQLLEQTGDVGFVIMNAKFLFNHQGHPGTGPDFSAKSISFGSMRQAVRQERQLIRPELGRSTRPGTGTQSGPAACHHKKFSNSCNGL